MLISVVSSYAMDFYLKLELNDWMRISIVLAAKCQVVESWEHVYVNFILLNSIQKETGENGTIEIELFVFASRDANILFASKEKVNITTDDVYEISIGA